MVGLRRGADQGSQFIEVSIAMAISMIAFVLVGTVLLGASRQERITDETANTVDTARFALARIVDEVREARTLEMDGDDGIAWFDHNGDGVRDADEVHRYAFRSGTDPCTWATPCRLVRTIDTQTEQLAAGLTAGSLAVQMLRNGPLMTISVTVPGVDEHRTGTTLTSEVSTRGNF